MKNENTETFYERILYILKMKKIPLVNFYQNLHIAKSTVQNWKKGIIPSGETLITLATYLDVLPEWLIYGNTDCNTSDKVPQSIIVTRIYEKLHELTGVYENNEAFYAPLENQKYILKLQFWDRGFQRIDLNTLLNISEKLNISLNNLIAGKTIGEINENEKIYVNNKTEEYLLKYYRCLSEKGKNNVFEYDKATFIKERYDESIKEKNPNSPFKPEWDPFDDPNFDGDAFV